MRDYLLKVESQEDRIMILPNVWLGVSAERQQEADERIPLLLQTPAAVRFISAEPLLGPIDLTCCGTHYKGSGPLHLWRAGGKKVWRKQFMAPPPEIDWVIAGGESGLNARPSHPDWYRSLRDQCATAGVSFFMKQWGNWKPIDQFPNGGIIRGASKHAVVDRDGRYVIDTDVADPPRTVFTFNMGKKSAGRLLDGVEYNEMPEVAR
jgi:protein gp37